MKKALVLCGGIPQIELINNLKARGIWTILADMNENVIARKYADAFYPISVLAVDDIINLARKEEVNFVITVCADQVLQVVAEVSERLGLPCYIDFNTSVNVSKKTYMKDIFIKNGIPTSRYLIMDEIDLNAISKLKYPLIVKPVDSYSSRGVKKVSNIQELQIAFAEAKKISRTNDAIIEEFVVGKELSVDVYVENGTANILCISHLDKIPNCERFVINRTRCPANISKETEGKIGKVAQSIADSFGLTNSPMLIQLISDGVDISVVEFCARTGGGDKFRLIKKASGFDVVDAVVELTLGNKPHVSKKMPEKKYILNEFLYAKEGVFDHLEGFDKLLTDGIITEYYQLKTSGTKITEVKSSGDRVAYLTIESDNIDDQKSRLEAVNSIIKAIDEKGTDILWHDIVAI